MASKKNSKKNEKKVTLQPIWITIAMKIIALLEGDPEIKTEYDDDNTTLNIWVDEVSGAKAMALSKLIPSEYECGNVTLKVNIIPSDSDAITSDIINIAFKGNPHFEGTVRSELPGFDMEYAIFKKEVIQFYNDDLSDYCGNYNGLAEDIAREVFVDTPGINFCTKVEK